MDADLVLTLPCGDTPLAPRADTPAGPRQADAPVQPSTATPAELLFFLANDAAEAAPCSACPAGEAGLRDLLGHRLASLLPGLVAADQARLTDCAWAKLSLVMQHATGRVRTALSELGHDLPNAARAAIGRLLGELAAPGAPLTGSSPAAGIVSAISLQDVLALLDCARSPIATQGRARSDLLDRMATSVGGRAQAEPIRSLLADPAMAVREAALDGLVACARAAALGARPPRPAVSAGTETALLQSLGDHLLNALADRALLAAATVATLRDRLGRQLAAPVETDRTARERRWRGEAGAMLADGTLSDSTIMHALSAGETDRVVVLLAAAAGVSSAAVERAGVLRSAKAAVSLVWKAGLSMRVAGAVQTMLCQIPPGEVLQAGRDGGFPLSAEEMRWQTEFVTHSTG